jgi:Ser/Thr protein kinase RdoA (MazF antagonist)
MATYDEGEGGWVVLVFEEVAGRHPTQPWHRNELDRVINAIGELAEVLTPSPLAPPTVGAASDAFATHICGWRQLCDEQSTHLAELDAWSQRHLAALVELEAQAPAGVAGETLLHFDIRADNLLLTAERVWFVDWPHACVGAAWVDVVGFAPSVAMQGGPPVEEVLARHPASRSANPDAISAAIAALAGYFTQRSLQPPPPGIPTVRAFQAAQGVVARQWVAQRMGWS